MPNLLPFVPVVALIAGVATWWLGIRPAVHVTGRHSTSFFPVMVAGGPPPPDFDVFEFTATNRSLVYPVFVRALGASGQTVDGEMISVEGPLKSRPTRLERQQAHVWEMSFAEFAEGGIDLRKGVRAWVRRDGRQRFYRSRLIKPGPTSNRAIPAPAPRTKPRG